MTAATLTPNVTTDRAARRRALEGRAYKQAFWGAVGMVWQIGVWFWAIYFAIQVISTIAVGVWMPGEDLDFSVSQAAPIYVFVMGILAASTLLRLHVLSGGTRRSAIRGWLVAAPVIGVTFALTQTLVSFALSWLAGLFGFEATPSAGPVEMVLGLVVLITTGFLSGVAVAAGYRTFGGGLGTLALPVLAGPGVVSLYLLGSFGGSDGLIGSGIGEMQLLAARLCVVVAAVFVWLLLRRIPVR